MTGFHAPSARRASRIVGLQITIASGALVVLALVAAVLYVLQHLRPAELREQPVPGENRIYIDSTGALIAIAIIGVAAVAVAGVLSVIITRRAVQPLGDALRMQQAFVADASHELRTPLAVLDARLQVLQRGLAPGDQVTEAVAELRRDTRTLIDIVTDLLLAADNGEPPRDPHSLLPSVEAAVEAMRMLATTRDIRVEIASPADVRTLLPPVAAQRCLLALLDNAVGHSPDGSAITVSMAVEGGTVSVRVRDHGTGIVGLDPARIFDRFAHSTAPDARARPSFGIGLALVRDVAARYGGTVRVEDTSTAGTTMLLVLPVFVSAPRN